MRSLALLSAFLPLCLGALYDQVSQLPTHTYDFVVVGAGNAGLVIASRLTENSKFSVLVLEAGISDKDQLTIEIPLLCPTLAGTEVDWNYTTADMPGLNNRTIPYPRGKVLGGSSSINYLTYSRGSQDDYDRYANFTGDQGWSWKNLQPYILKSEKFVKPQDNHNITGDFIPSVHGYNGLLPVSLPGYPTPLDDRVSQTLQEFSDEFPYNEDLNSGNTIGVGWEQKTSQDGRRYSSSTAYLAPYINRPNLHVLINAHVTKLVQTGTENGVPAFRTVEFAANASAPVTQVKANKEVVLSAGSIGTPQILMLSGIGDKSALAALGINSTVNLPSVGQNLTDHPLLPNNYFVNGTETFDDIYRNATVRHEQIAIWNKTRQGPLVDSVVNQYGWLRFPPNSSIFETVEDPSAGPTSAHYEIIFSNNGVFLGTPYPATGNFMNVNTAVISPTSRGYVKLNSSAPFDPPIINPNMLATDFDIFTMREAVKAANQFLTGSAWSGYVLSPFGALANATTDAQIEEYARENTFTVYHPVSTASMSPRGAPFGVVDPDLLVKGAAGIRVVDASVLPFIPSAHTQAPVYIIAERAADLIKEAHH